MGSSRVTGADQSRTQSISLIERQCQLGRLLPAVDNIDTDESKNPLSEAVRRVGAILKRDPFIMSASIGDTFTSC
jgi:hypothetical protein